ncbi:FecR family protein [Sphingobacterium sp. 1.A.5]|uniref:FecR family protein n=1 Tax=Sphingobacterium sp. 1.A.5 TaxID=2044604 RepID=UPI000C0C0456|nr:FecR family protein [Sphingobacterium sp. 1.A.5]
MQEKDNIQYFQELLQKYKEGKCTIEEQAIINAWFYHGFDDKDESLDEKEIETISRELNERINDSTSSVTSKSFSFYKYLSIAAILFAVFLISFFVFKHHNSNVTLSSNSSLDSSKIDLLPGKRFATIKFEDGTVDENPDSTTEKYSSNSSKVLTMEVPIASTFSLILNDGTKVWLNSSSKISYPTKFDSDIRKVTIEGEAYFDVVKDIDRPFIIEANVTEIQVLGTSFNVNAYNKIVSTTLVEGSLIVSNGNNSSIIKPGQEAITNAGVIEIAEPNLLTKTAWQRGEFFFDGNNLHEILEQLKRWYNVDVEGLDQLNYKSTFKGSIDKDQNLSSVLKILNLATGKNLELINKTIIIK